MSSGPGILQKQIIDTLQNHDSFIFHRTLLWQIGFQRNEIEIEGKLCSEIEKGHLRNSFKENFRRAVQKLGETGRIEIREEKITDLDYAFDYFPYHTGYLEIHQLRKKLLPTIKEYIKENNPKRFWYSEIEENQISKIRKTEKFLGARRHWRSIQKNIISILNSGDTDMFDQWLQCLIRGRYLFSKRTVSHSKSLVLIYNTLESQENMTTIESNTLKRLKTLIQSTFDKANWKLGELKSIYYKIANFQRQYRDTLSEEVKDYLRSKHEALILSLPGHEEPPPPIEYKTRIGKRNGVMRMPQLEKRRYSDYLDKLITKQILKNQRSIKLP